MRLKSFLIVGFAVLALAGCSGGGDAATTPSPAATPAASTPAP